MRHVAISSLAHDRTKVVSAVAGVAFATALVLAQAGIYRGFIKSSSAVLRHAGGDVWLMARGTRVLDFGEALSAGAALAISGHACVERVRPIVFSWAPLRKRGGGADSVQVIGVEPRSSRLFPWSLAEGLPGDLEPPLSISVDESDLEKLELPPHPIGLNINVRDHLARIAAVTRGIRGFTLQPYAFATIGTARRLVGLADGQVNYLVVDLKNPACAPDVIAAAERVADLQAMTAETFATVTERYWVNGSGAGAVLGFSALLGLVVGVVIVGQTLYSMTKDHQRELATLKAMGASGGELFGFVAWQAGFLAVVGGALGTALAFLLQRVVALAGLNLELSVAVLAGGYAAIVLMCALASIASIRKVLSLEAAEVFK